MTISIVQCALAGALTIAVSGCATYRAEPLDPARELLLLSSRDLDSFIVERAQPRLGSSVEVIAFDPSDGLCEQEVVAVALTLNPDLKAKRAEIGEAQAQLITAGQWPNPEIGIGWRPGIGSASGYSVDADALFELLRPGERSAREAIANSRIDETRASIAAEELNLVAAVRLQWMSILAAEQIAGLLKQDVALRERTADLVRQRRKIGEGTELDVSLADLDLAEARRDLRKMQADEQAERRALNKLLGLPTAYDVRLSDSGKPLLVTIVDNLDERELDRRLLSGRLELSASQSAYQRAEEELRLAVVQQYPRLKIGPSYEHDFGGDNGLGLGLSLELPLFNQNQGEIAEKLAQRNRVHAQYTALLHSLRADAHAAVADLRRMRTEVETQERDVLPLVLRGQELFEGAFRARELSVVDLVTAQQRAIRARREYLDVLVQYRKALIRLEAAIGQVLLNPIAPNSATTKPN